MSKQKIQVTTEVKQGFILCSTLCRDGSLIKKKYIDYRLSEAKKLFTQYILSNNLY